MVHALSKQILQEGNRRTESGTFRSDRVRKPLVNFQSCLKFLRFQSLKQAVLKIPLIIGDAISELSEISKTSASQTEQTV